MKARAPAPLPGRRVVAAVASALLVLLLPRWVDGSTPEEATVYYNEACSDCARYINGRLIPLLRQLGVPEVTKKDYINDRSVRRELVERGKRLAIPPELQGHFTVFIGEEVILEGHVPEGIIRDLLQRPRDGITTLVYQDAMGENVTSYKVWAFRGPVKEFPVTTPVTEYLDWFAANKDDLDAPKGLWNASQFIPLIVSTGLLDGINPCAFAVSLFFIAFLFTIKRTRTDIAKVGAVYVAMIYLTYLGIGLGLLQALVLTGAPHLMAKLGSGLLIALGLVNVKDYFWYGRWFTLSPSGKLHEASMTWLKKATLPATALGGFLVGLCTFPCSGGIYVAVLGLLSARATYWMGVGYLLLYNLMFVVPLIAILVGFSNRRAIGRLSRWEVSRKREVKLASGLIMIALGAVVLIWFV